MVKTETHLKNESPIKCLNFTNLFFTLKKFNIVCIKSTNFLVGDILEHGDV
jgi:hypothetical protein